MSHLVTPRHASRLRNLIFLFVMGDNRPNSSDSRVFGPIDQDLAVGQAWLRIWPLNEFGIVQHVDLPLAGAPVSQ